MRLLPKQDNAIHYLKDPDITEIIYGGAAGGGKSALGCLWLIENCQKFAGTRWLMGRSKLKDLKATTLKTFFEISSKLNVTNQFKYNAQDKTIYWNNGSEIVLRDLFLYPSDPEFQSLGSLEISGAFIDEVGQIVYKAWEMVKSRIRYKLTPFGIKILGTTNPTKNWVYREFYKTPRRKDRMFIRALPKDNPHLPQSYLEVLLSLDEQSRQRLYYGNWEYDDDPSALLTIDEIQDYFNPKHVEKTGEMFITADVARKGKDKTVIRVWDGWLCINRTAMDISLVNEVVEQVQKLQTKYKVTRSRTIVDEDGVGGGVVDYLRCKGFVNNSRPLNEENYENLKAQCTVKMAWQISKGLAGEMNQNQDEIDSITEEMEQVKYRDLDKDGKIKIIKKQDVISHLGRSPDDWDSIMMRYWFELTPRGARPTRGRKMSKA